MKINGVDLVLPINSVLTETAYYFQITCPFETEEEMFAYGNSFSNLVKTPVETEYVFSFGSTTLSPVYFLNMCYKITNKLLEIIFVKHLRWISKDLSALVKNGKTTIDEILNHVLYIDNYKIVNERLLKYKLNRFELPEEATQRKFKVVKQILTDGREIKVNGFVKELIIDLGGSL